MPEKGLPVDVRGVIDGDTLELKDGRRVRLIGINAPEINRRGGPSEPFAQAARLELERAVAGRGLRLVVGADPKDKYGRTLAHLFDGRGINIEASMLRKGLGFAVGIAPNLALLDCHLAKEVSARRERAGVWRLSPAVQAAAVKDGGFKVVQGRVVRVGRTATGLWLELGGPVVLKIAKADEHRFEDIGQWVGSLLETRGWLIDRQERAVRRRGHKRFMLPVSDSRLVSFELSR